MNVQQIRRLKAGHHYIQHHHRCLSKHAMIKMDNFNANKQIKDIFMDAKSDCEERQNDAISKIFSIYATITERPNHFIINKMLRVCFDLKCAHKLLNIWKDMEQLHKNPHECKDIQYAVLLKCCIQSDDIAITKCIQALEWMTTAKYTFKTQNNIIIKLITKCNDIDSLRYIHSLFRRKFIESTKKDSNDIYVQTAFIKAFGGYNDIQSACNIFGSIKQIDTVCINTMLQALIHNSYNQEAVDLYTNYGNLMDHVSHSLIIKACSNTDIDNVSTKNILLSAKNSNNIHVLTNLMEFYANKCEIDTVLDIYNSIPDAVNERDNVSTCMMMKIYLHHRDYVKVLELYQSIKHKDNVSHSLVLKACTNMKNKQVAFSIASKINVDICNVEVKNALIQMYGSYNDVASAERVHNSIDDHTQNISTNTMMKVYVSNRLNDNALMMYHNMHDRGIEKDAISHIVAIEACTNLLKYKQGVEIHANIAMKSDNIQIKTALIHFYGSCKDIRNAVNIFKSIANHQHTTKSVGSMMDAYCNNNYNAECIELFQDLQLYKYNNIEANIVCYSILFTACSNSTAYYAGREIHDRLKKDANHKWMLEDICIQSVLINFYAKCGMIQSAKQVFDDSQNKNEILLWNAMMHAYGKNGKLEKAKQWFNTMMDKVGVMSDSYAILLNACNHNANIEEAKRIWNDCINDEDMKYDCYVMSSLVNVLSRNGFLDEAVEYIQKYESYRDNKADHIMWMIVLSGCKKYENKELGKYAYEQYINKFGDNPIYKSKLGSASALFSNINATEAVHKRARANKQAEFSEIDLFGTLYKFYGEYNDNVLRQNMADMLSKLALYGYTNKIDDENMKHSEKLAVIYGLMNTENDYPLIVNKNLNICQDCHTFMALLSRIETRRLIVSDKDRVHIFENGKCDCRNIYI